MHIAIDLSHRQNCSQQEGDLRSMVEYIFAHNDFNTEKKRLPFSFFPFTRENMIWLRDSICLGELDNIIIHLKNKTL